MIVAFLFQAVLPVVSPKLATDLRSGMLLVYASDGGEQPPWSIDFVESRVALKDHADCARLRIRRQPSQAEPDENRLCVEKGTLYVWDSGGNTWLPQRPVGPGMELILPRPNGDVVQYTTGTVSEEVISGLRLSVLETTVTTVDSSGRPRRRLRERYALTLATATGGRFEVPDPDAPVAWRTQQVFELREIRMPESH